MKDCSWVDDQLRAWLAGVTPPQEQPPSVLEIPPSVAVLGARIADAMAREEYQCLLPVRAAIEIFGTAAGLVVYYNVDLHVALGECIKSFVRTTPKASHAN